MHRYVIDIDGTICDSSFGYETAFPYLERIDRINELYDEGNHITYFTARGMGSLQDPYKAINKYYKLTLDQLESWGCRFNLLILGKPSADFYIDDKSINIGNFFKETNE